MKTGKQQTVPNILIKFAELLGTEIKNGRLEIPEKFGRGYCAGFVFNEHIRMLILNYELNEDVVVENPDLHIPRKIQVFKFQNIIPKPEIPKTRKPLKSIPSVLVATGIISDAIIPIDTHNATIIIEVDETYLNGLDLPEKSPVLQSLLQNTQPLLFEQMIYPTLQKIVDEVVAGAIDATFEQFFLRIKAEELIYRLFVELEKRDEKHLYDLNMSDIRAIYQVKEQILERLEIPPVINELAICAGMSASKLKRIFRQIFGNSIFSYYQGFRMKEAARLLKEEKLSVSDVGYRLGFTNLSHFTRVFEAHIGMKPKQYSRSQKIL